MSTPPTNIVVTRKRVTSRAVDRSPASTRAVPTTATAASAPWSSPPLRRVIRASTRRTLSSAAWTGGHAGVAAQHVRLAQCGAQVVAGRDALLGGAAWSVQAASSTTLRSATWGSSRRTTQYVANPVSGKRKAAGHQARLATTQSGPEARRVRTACHTPQRISWPTSHVSSSMRSSTSPTACSDSSESGWAIAASSRSARSLPSARSHTVAQIVLATVSMTAPPTTHSASSTTSVEVACSASRPATIDPRDAATAPSRDIVKHTTVRGRRTRRQSTGTRSAGIPRTPKGPVLARAPRLVVRQPGHRHNP